jgi:hypothetical protein
MQLGPNFEFYFIFACLIGFTPHRHSIGHMAKLQLLLVKENIRSFSLYFQARTDARVKPPTFYTTLIPLMGIMIFVCQLSSIGRTQGSLV